MEFSEVLEQLSNWWNNNVAVANTAGLATSLITLAFVYVSAKLKKKNNEITIDVKQSTDEVEKLALEIKELKEHEAKLIENVALLTDLLYTFANGTKIDEGVKRELSKVYGKIDTDGKPKVKELVEKVKNTVGNVASDVIETIKEESNYDKLKKSLE